MNVKNSKTRRDPDKMARLGNKPWVWVSVFLFMALAAECALATIVLNLNPLMAQGAAPKVGPTPLAFVSGSPVQPLIVVANLQDKSNDTFRGLDPAQLVYDQLTARIKDKSQVRVERLYEALDENGARRAGRVYNATLVIWGWTEASSATFRVQRIVSVPDRPQAGPGSPVPAEPDQLQFNGLTDVGSQAPYVALVTLALERRASGRSDDALAYLDAAVTSVPTQTVGLQGYEAYFFRGLSYYSKDEHAHALADLDKAVELQPDDASAQYDHGLAALGQANYDRALLDFSRAIQLKPDYEEAYMNRGLAYFAKHAYDPAVADYTRAIQLKPDSAWAFYNRGVAYGYVNNEAQAIADLDQAIQIEPDLAEAYRYRGLVYAQKGDYDRAIVDYSHAIDVNPNYGDAYDSRCWAYYQQGRYNEALTDCEEAARIHPHDPATLLDRAFVYKALNRPADAVGEFQRVINLTEDQSIIARAEQALMDLGRP